MICDLKISEFELHEHLYVYFWVNTLGKRTDPLISTAMGQIVQLLFFYKDGFAMK